MRKRIEIFSALAALAGVFAGESLATGTINLVYTSDPHYAITRDRFHQASKVNAQPVNRAMIRQINTLPGKTLPSDAGILAGSPVGAIDYLVETGDIANRMDSAKSYQSDSASWSQFWSDYNDSLTILSRASAKPTFLLAPGNHDVTNAIGFYGKMIPDTDPTSMVEIFNRMLNPASPKTNATYNYATDKVNYSREIGGVHFLFVNMWPDSANRIWMETDLSSVAATTPVVIFTHDQPSIETKHLTSAHDTTPSINAKDKFENMVAEHIKDGALTINDAATIEQRGFATFLKAHKNIRAYFHGNDNANEFYTWTGPDNDVALPTFRVDSPMKGNFSASDETKLSFHLISLDSSSQTMTVREVRWNPDSTKYANLVWGQSKTLSLKVDAGNDSLILAANALVDTNYTIPSWTMLLRAKTKLAATGSAEAAAALKTAIAALKAKDMPFSVTANFNGNPTTQMGFNWFANANTAGGKVQIVSGRTGEESAFASPTISVDATTSSYTTNYNVSGNNLFLIAGIADNTKKTYTVNKALATNLSANTVYSYRVGKPGAWSPIGHFTTAKADKSDFSFLYFTDPQAQNDDMFSVSAKTMHTAVGTAPGAKFILSCGDLVESTSPNAEWEYEQFFQTQQDIWNEYAFAPLEGNHDNSSNKNFTRHFNTTVTPFDSALSTVPGSVYSFVYGDALFMAMSYESYSAPGYLDSLKNWMKQQVAANPNTKWRVAFYHKTMYTGSSSHQSDADGKLVRETMGPIFDSLDIDLALQGHDHIYEVIGPIANKTLVAGAVTNQTTVTPDARANVTGKLGGTFDVSQGTLYFLNNSAGKKKYEPRSQHVMDSVEAGLGLSNYFGMFTGRFGQTGEPTFSEVKFSTDSINISTYTVNEAGTATLFDAIKVVKGANATSTKPSAKQPVLRATFATNGKSILVAGNIEGQPMKVALLDVMGNHLVDQDTDKSSITLNVPALSRGIYLVNVHSGSTHKTFQLAHR